MKNLNRHVRQETNIAMHQLEHGERPKLTQAERVILKFDGARKLAKALNLDPSTVYKWTYPRSKKGCGGIIPSSVIEQVMVAARREGILLTAEDLLPGRR